MVMIAFVGVATFDNPGKGATSIPHWLLLALITLLAQLREAAVHELGSQTKVALPIVVSTWAKKAFYVRLSGAEGA
jgi:hypothetical protein